MQKGKVSHGRRPNLPVLSLNGWIVDQLPGKTQAKHGAPNCGTPNLSHTEMLKSDKNVSCDSLFLFPSNEQTVDLQVRIGQNKLNSKPHESLRFHVVQEGRSFERQKATRVTPPFE